MSAKYVLLDAMGIQSYIFRTNTLRIILGSSLALARWQEDCRGICYDCGGTLITYAGGNVLARFDAPEKAVKFKDESRQKAPPGMEIAWAMVDGSGKREEDPKRWGDLQIEIAGYKAGNRDTEDYLLPSAKGCLSPATLDLSGCKHCGIKPKGGAKKVDGRPVCSDCLKLYELSAELQSEHLGKTVIEKICCPPPGHPAFTTDLKTLVTDAQDKQELLAVVVFDLNDMGIKIRKVVKSDGFEKLREFSSTLQTDFCGVFQETIEEIASPKGLIRLRPLMVAGDDAVFAMPASIWLPFVRNVLPKLSKKGLSACAGVAIAKHTYPINRLAQMAEELVGNAKNKYRREKKKTDAVIDWHVHQEASFTSPLEIRKRTYIPVKDEDSRYEIATRRPYTWEELDDLILRAEELKDFSSRKLFSLYRALRNGTKATRNTLVYTFLRDEKENLERYKPLWDWIKDTLGDEPLWEKTTFESGSNKPEIYDTKIADLIELSWFLPSEKEGLS